MIFVSTLHSSSFNYQVGMYLMSFYIHRSIVMYCFVCLSHYLTLFLTILLLFVQFMCPGNIFCIKINNASCVVYE